MRRRSAPRGPRRRGTARASTLRGTFASHRDGFGFVDVGDGRADVFVGPAATGGAYQGDLVDVRLVRPSRPGGREGVVVRIVERRKRRVFGLYRERDGLVEPFDPAAGLAVRVPGAFRQGARDGEAVGVEVLRVVRPGGPAEGKIVEILGPLEAPGVDAVVVARRHGLSLEFPPEVLDAAARLPDVVPLDEVRRRERFDRPPAVTIDGETARDFDDAIAVAELPGGGFRLFVHIADVAWFAKPGGPLDLEARARGTSVYFPHRVLPMFPEKLSNDLCSLVPHEDRLVQTAVLDLSADGALEAARFADGVIRSSARLTYTQVSEFLEGRSRSPARGPVGPMLETAERLREVLGARRHGRGSVDFDLPEPRILLDVEGAMTGVVVEPRNRAHRMIEEFMLAANEAVAAHLQSQGAPCLYRVHEAPDPAKVDALAAFAASFGLALVPGRRGLGPGDVQRLLESAEGRPEHRLISQVALRSMRQARYDPTNIGHFGLAAPVYCHFTSPIRRYPDLVVHRLLRAQRRRRKDRLVALAKELAAIGEACSRLEREAEAAERELLEWKKIAFMKGREGEAFRGIVSAVARFGLFVQLSDVLVEGLVRVERLGDEWFEFMESRQELVGSRTGRRFAMGEPLAVVVERVDPVLRRVDLTLADGEAPGRRGRRPRR